MIRRRLYDPDHCAACGDFLPCGDSWIKDADDLPDVLAGHLEVECCASGRCEVCRLEARHRANGEGWRCTETIDLCPEHNNVKVPTETCWRGECRTGCYYIETCAEGENWA